LIPDKHEKGKKFKMMRTVSIFLLNLFFSNQTLLFVLHFLTIFVFILFLSFCCQKNQTWSTRTRKY